MKIGQLKKCNRTFDNDLAFTFHAILSSLNEQQTIDVNG